MNATSQVHGTIFYELTMIFWRLDRLPKDPKRAKYGCGRLEPWADGLAGWEYGLEGGKRCWSAPQASIQEGASKQCVPQVKKHTLSLSFSTKNSLLLYFLQKGSM